jgi:type IV pilus assembly protein PilA
MKNEVKKNNKGFSLVELIVVIAIMAVLVGVLAPQFIKYVEKSREATDIQNISSIGDALMTYYSDHQPSGTDTTIIIQLDQTYDATSNQGVALANAGFGTGVASKGNWTTAPSVTYTISTTGVTYSGESDYYTATDATDFTAK